VSYRVDTRGLLCCSKTKQQGRRWSAAANDETADRARRGRWRRWPASFAAARRNNGQLTRRGRTVHAPPQRRTGPRPGDALPPRPNKAAVHQHL